MVKSAIPAPPRPRIGSSADRVGSSAIRDLLALAERPEVISLAGGLPDPSTFPTEAIAAAVAQELAGEPSLALQYGPTEGDPELRTLLADRLGTDRSQVIVTAGAQQALALVARAVLDPGDVVALADPAYVGALQALRAADARLAPLPSDGGGLRVDALAKLIEGGTTPALVYVVSSFDNPTGATLDHGRRVALAELAEEHGFWILDDDPYGDLRWSGAMPIPLRELTDRTITVGTTSKILAPGLRVGWVAADPELARAVTVVKQSTDLHTSSLSQRVVLQLLSDDDALAGHVTALRATYRRRADALASALEHHLPGALTYERPEGGMFLWATLATEVVPGLDTELLLAQALDHGVAFVPGAAFAAGPATRHHRSLRLSYATSSPERLEDAARRLAQVVCS